jgi:hypothetical protein
VLATLYAAATSTAKPIRNALQAMGQRAAGRLHYPPKADRPGWPWGFLRPNRRFAEHAAAGVRVDGVNVWSSKAVVRMSIFGWPSWRRTTLAAGIVIP